MSLARLIALSLIAPVHINSPNSSRWRKIVILTTFFCLLHDFPRCHRTYFCITKEREETWECERKFIVMKALNNFFFNSLQLSSCQWILGCSVHASSVVDTHCNEQQCNEWDEKSIDRYVSCCQALCTVKDYSLAQCWWFDEIRHRSLSSSRAETTNMDDNRSLSRYVFHRDSAASNNTHTHLS